MHKIRFAIIENAGCALWKTRRKNANRIHRDNPKALSISKLPTNPSVLSLPYDHRCHTFRLLKKTDRKRLCSVKNIEIRKCFLRHCVLSITASSFLAEGCFLALFSYKESGKEFAIALCNRLSGKHVHEQSDD